MKYRVYFTNRKYFPAYFKTKKEAVAYKEQFGSGEIQRKIGGEWFFY